MLNVYRSNRQERLVDALAAVLAKPVGPPTELEWIAVQSAQMKAWLGMRLSERIGVWAGVKVLFPRTLVEQLLFTVLGDQVKDFALFTEECLTWAIMTQLPRFLKTAEFEALDKYLNDDKSGFKRFQLAKRIAHVFDEYSVYRPEMVLSWEETPSNSWQATLWNALVKQLGSAHIARGAKRFLDAIDSDSSCPGPLPRRVSLVGISSLPPLFVQILAVLAQKTEVNLFLVSPSEKYWADIISKRNVTHDLKGLLPDHEEAEDDLYLEQGNPLLASYGRIGRDFERVLEELVQYHEPMANLYEDPIAQSSPNLISTLQSDILSLRYRRKGANSEQEGLKEIPLGDTSVTIHSCHSPMREVEVLKDQLLSIFDDEEIKPRPDEVLVMMPDVEVYAPFVKAVFEDQKNGGAIIPFIISDLSTQRGLNVVDAFLALIDIAHQRAGLEEVLDLAMRDPVRKRFGLEPSDVDIARGWLIEAGVRWGIDGKHRAMHGQPELEENTWRFGLDRLLLGYAMPGEERNLFCEILPFDELEGGETEILGKFVAFAETLFACFSTLGKPRSLQNWAIALENLLEQMINRDESNSHQHDLICNTLSQLRGLAEKAGFDESLNLDVVREILCAKFEKERYQKGPSLGGVNFSNLLSMRNIPFKVICLMGMNERDFPRSRRAPSFDLMALSPRMGDRSVRNDDRYLFLQALISARKRLVITYVGQDIRDNSTIGPSVVVSDLLDVIEEGFSKAIRNHLVLTHPLHPFSPRYFNGGRNQLLNSYSLEHCEEARAVNNREEISPFFNGPLPVVSDGEQVVTLNELASFFRLPCRYLFKNRLGITTSDDAKEVDEREPIEPNVFDEYSMVSFLLELGLEGENLEELFQVFKAKGVLPLGTAGRVRYEVLQDQISSFVEMTLIQTAGEPLEPLEVNLRALREDTDTRLVGRLRGIWPQAMVLYRFGSIKPSNLLELWIQHLALNCVDKEGYPKKSIWFGRKDSRGVDTAALGPILENPFELLADLVQLYWLGQEIPLLLFPAASFVYANTRLSSSGDDSEQRAMTLARREWNNSHERSDTAVCRILRNIDPLDDEGIDPERSFKALAVRVFEPLINSLEQGVP